MYRYFRRYLQLLSYRYKAESHWVLKAPLHALYIKALVREFPDVRIINTHRDPKDIIASWTKSQFQMVRAADVHASGCEAGASRVHGRASRVHGRANEQSARTGEHSARRG